MCERFTLKETTTKLAEHFHLASEVDFTPAWNIAQRQNDKLLPMICPHDAEFMQAWQVSREVNKVGLRNDAGLIEPIGVS